MSALIYVHSSAYVSRTRMYADIRRANIRGYSAADTQTRAMVCARVPASLPLCMCLDSQVTQDAVTWKLNLNLSATFPSRNPPTPDPSRRHTRPSQATPSPLHSVSPASLPLSLSGPLLGKDLLALLAVCRVEMVQLIAALMWDTWARWRTLQPGVIPKQLNGHMHM